MNTVQAIATLTAKRQTVYENRDIDVTSKRIMIDSLNAELDMLYEVHRMERSPHTHKGITRRKGDRKGIPDY